MKPFFIMWMMMHVLFLPLRLVGQSSDRLTALRVQLDSLAHHQPNYQQISNIALQQVPLSEYIRALGRSHQLNLFIEDTPSLLVSADWSSATVQDILYFVCEQYQYQLQPIGSILALRPYRPPSPSVVKANDPSLRFEKGRLSADLQSDSLSKILPFLSRLTGKRILMRPDLQGTLTAFLPPTPLDTALEAIFRSNGYQLQAQKKGYYLLSDLSENSPYYPTLSSANYELTALTDGESPLLTIDVDQAALDGLLKEIFQACELNYLQFEAVIGEVSLHAELIELDELLRLLFQGTEFTFRKTENLYLIGEKNRSGLGTTRVVHLRYRPTYQAMALIPGIESIEERGQSQTMTQNPESVRFPQNSNPYSGTSSSSFPQETGPSVQTASPPPLISSSQLGQVKIVEYPELNRIILKGPEDEIAELVQFLQLIDQPVPMVKVEMLVLEVNQDRLLQTGVSAGMKASSDTSSLLTHLLPQFQTELSGSEVNSLIGQIPALSHLGRLSQDFYLQLRAEEARGNLKINMQPVLSMLNGRSASLVIGQTQYFLLETQTAATGAVNNFSQFSQRFERIEANIQLSLRPFISADSTVTLEVLPNFTSPVGSFDAKVPPTIATRKFDSTIRVKDGETVILGGLTEERSTEATKGLPFLSRIPFLKYLFGDTEKGKSRNSLLIYLTPTIYYQ